MTILGLHTVAETRDLIRATEFRVNQELKLWGVVKGKRIGSTTPQQAQLDADIVAFVRRWTDVRDAQTMLMLASVLANPGVATFILPAEQQFVAIDNATRRDNPRLGDIQNRLDTEAAGLGIPPVDLSATPAQNSPDADFVTLKKLDAAIAASGLPPAGKEGTASAPFKIGLVVGLVGIGVVGVVVATKVYL